MRDQRELLAIREIVHAFLSADRPDEAFQFALDRVSPVIGAAFASAYLLEGASELMRPIAAHNWPERFRPWLSDVRVRVGFGPSGEAASERRVIAVPDVFADPDLEDWQEVARELGFSAIVSLPLQSASRVLGAVTFYFRERDDLTPEQRGLLRLVADLMAGAAERSQLVDRARRAEAATTDAQGELERMLVRANEVRESHGRFVTAAAVVMRQAVESAASGGPGLARAHALVDDLALMASVLTETATVAAGTVDPRLPLRDAMRSAAAEGPEVHLVAEEPIYPLPVVRTDLEKLARVLARLLVRALHGATGPELRATVGVADDRVEYRVPDTGSDDAEWRFATTVSRLLGATLEVRADGAGSVAVLSLPIAPAERTETN